MRTDVAAAVGEQRERLRGEPPTVPQVRKTARHPTDLCTAHAQTVVVELLAKPHLVRAGLIERQIDDGALRPQRAQRSGEAGRLPPALERHVGPVVGWAVPPQRLDGGGDVHSVLVERQQPEPLRRGQPRRGAVRHGHRRRAVLLREQRGEEPHDSGAGHQHRATAYAVAEGVHVAAGGVGCRVQQPVGADRPHVRDVHPEQGIELLR
ncbi:hypothetical protein BH24ACT13_BH24ACT13_03210 [soil metagenome]